MTGNEQKKLTDFDGCQRTLSSFWDTLIWEDEPNDRNYDPTDD